MRGRKPLPANVHLLRGNPSKLSAAELREGVTADVEVPEPPAHLAGEALIEWGRITDELARLRLIAGVDRSALVLYCEAWGQYAHAVQRITALDGELVITHSNGTQGPTPWLAIRDKAAEQCRRLLIEFGCTPSARTRVKASPQPDLFGDDSGYFS